MSSHLFSDYTSEYQSIAATELDHILSIDYFFLEHMINFKSIDLLFFFISAIYDIGVSTYLFDIFQYSVIVLIQYPH